MPYCTSAKNSASGYSAGNQSACDCTTQQSETLVVTASAPENTTQTLKGMVAKSSDAGTKIPVPLVKTPQSISVVTRDQMDAQGVFSVSDALNYTSDPLLITVALQIVTMK